jgi:hypothetical protein
MVFFFYIYFETIYNGCGFISNNFMILDLDYSKFNNSFALLNSHDNVDSFKWHDGLSHIA